MVLLLQFQSVKFPGGGSNDLAADFGVVAGGFGGARGFDERMRC